MLGLNHEFDYEEIVNGISEILENKLIGDTMERLQPCPFEFVRRKFALD